MSILEGNKNNFDSLIKNKNILVDFWASWCGPCRMLAEEIKNIKDEIDIIKINTDTNSELCKKYGIMSIPTLLYFKKDGTYEKKTGFMTKEDIIKWIGDKNENC